MLRPESRDTRLSATSHISAHFILQEVHMAKILITHGIPTAGLELLADHELMMPAPLMAYSMEELQNLRYPVA